MKLKNILKPLFIFALIGITGWLFVWWGFNAHADPISLRLRIVKVVELKESNKYYTVEVWKGFMRGWEDVNPDYDNRYTTLEQAQNKVQKIERKVNNLTRTIVE